MCLMQTQKGETKDHPITYGWCKNFIIILMKVDGIWTEKNQT